MKLTFPYQLISEQRTPLMGWAILFIMLSHAFSPSWANIPFLHVITGKFFALNDVGGFLFLSGFGLYYSFSKNDDVRNFYKKRLYRLYIPFLITALPFYILSFASGEVDFVRFICSELALYFFIWGNNGMWYISLSLILYLLFPFFFVFSFEGRFQFAKWSALFLLSIMMNFILMDSCPAYYRTIAIGLNKIPMFIIGMYVGKLSLERKEINLIGYVGLAFLMVVLLVVSKKIQSVEFLYKDSIALVGIPLIAVIFKFCDKKIPLISSIFKWLGSYSLELYMLHMLLRNAFFSCIDMESMPTYLVKLFICLVLILSLLLCKPLHNFTSVILGKLP